jgi:hypothetical protein
MKNFPLTHYFYGVCSSTIALLRMSTIYICCSAMQKKIGHWPTIPPCMSLLYPYETN